MKKKRLISIDSEYFKDNEEAIKLESCPGGGELCKSQMAFMNENLLLAHRLIENKEYIRAVELIKKSFDSTFDLQEKQCQGCADLFRESISNTLSQVISELEDITKGLFAIKKFKADLNIAQQLLQDMKENLERR